MTILSHPLPSPVLVTGATGLVGRALCAELLARGVAVRGAVRSKEAAARLAPGVESALVGDLGPETDWAPHLEGAQAVVHLAARVHEMGPETPASRDAFFRVNAEASAALGRACAASGVRRLVFVSTAKVGGEAADAARPLRATDSPAPQGAYAESKALAEIQLAALCHGGDSPELVILRPTLVYGPGAGANFAKLVRLVARSLPLPFGAARNGRSLLALDNFTDLLCLALSHPAAAGRTYYAADARPVSTAELIRRIAQGLGTPARIVPVPPGLLALSLRLLGRKALSERLLGSLVVDVQPLIRELGWTPPLAPEQAIPAAAAAIMAAEQG